MTAFDLLALAPSSASGWALVGVVVVPWLTGLALIITSATAGVLALVRATWRAATGRRPEPAAAPEPEQREHEQLLAALATAVRERDDALRQLAEHRRAADVTQETRLPADTLTLETV